MAVKIPTELLIERDASNTLGTPLDPVLIAAAESLAAWETDVAEARPTAEDRLRADATLSEQGRRLARQRAAEELAAAMRAIARDWNRAADLLAGEFPEPKL